MKKYILTALLACVSANATTNPFDLQKNLQKIDQDQDSLLKELMQIQSSEKVSTVKKTSVTKKKEELLVKKQEEKKKEEQAKKAKHAELLKKEELLRKEEAKKLALEKAKQDLIETEKRNIVNAKVIKQEQQKKIVVKKKAEPLETKVVDINIAQEQKDASIAADKAYLAAVKEVDQEEI